MPFQSVKQRGYLLAHPEITDKKGRSVGRKWLKEHGTKVEKNRGDGWLKPVVAGTVAGGLANQFPRVQDIEREARRKKKRKGVTKRLDTPDWPEDGFFNTKAAQQAYDLVMKMDRDTAEMFVTCVVSDALEADIEANRRTLQKHLNEVVAKQFTDLKRATMAAQEFDQNVNDTAERINDNAENKITQRFGDGRRFEATIPEEQVYDIVGWAAYQDKPEDSDWRGDQTIGVTWKEVDKDDMPLPDGEEYADTVRYSDIAEEWHLEPSYFNVSVLVLTEGHSSTKGKTEQVNFRKKHGYDSWVTTGPYVASPANRVFVGKSLPIQFMDLVPEDPVTMEEDEPFIGWPEPSDEDLSDYDRGD